LGDAAVIVLDTQVWLWWMNHSTRLSKKAQHVIDRAQKDGKINISSISVWEFCLLMKKGRLGFTKDTGIWLQKAEELPFLRFIPIDTTIARLSVELPEPFHKDPADRFIVATARVLGAALVTID
jgi:PIN domain nuclease of toxin-antitoxin system